MTRFAARRGRLMKLVKQTGAQGLLISNFTNVTCNGVPESRW